jgi:hypothetical protein
MSRVREVNISRCCHKREASEEASLNEAVTSEASGPVCVTLASLGHAMHAGDQLKRT